MRAAAERSGRLDEPETARPMGFDQHDPRPIIQPEKKTTKVNISLVAGVVLFFAIGIAAIIWFKSNHG